MDRLNKMSFRGLFLALMAGLVTVGAAMSGCGSSDAPSSSKGSTSGGSKATKIAFLSYTDADYQQAMVRGMKSTVASGGGSVTFFNANFDAQKQTQQCQDAVQSGRYNAIVLGAVDAATGQPCVAVAKNAKIPVVTIENAVGKDPNDLKPQVPGVIQTILTTPNDNAAGLRDLTRQACADTKPCKVIAEIATATDRQTTTIPKLIAATLPNVEVVQTIADQYDPGQLAKNLPDALSRHPDANVFVATADFQALAAVAILKRAGKTAQVKVVGNGGSKDGVAAIKSGDIFGSQGSWPEQWGRTAATALGQSVSGQKVSGPTAINGFATDKPLDVVRANVDQYKPEW